MHSDQPRKQAPWLRAFPIIPCDLCGSQEGLERNAMKAMLDDIERKMPGRKDVMIRALGNVASRHLLDRRLNPLPELRDAALAGGAVPLVLKR